VFRLQCSGPSMLPTVAERGDVVLVDKISLRWKPIEVGEVVTCDPPGGGRSTVCKRVLGTAGSKVMLQGRQQPVTVPPGHIWLAGDNASNSRDSRFYGPVPLGLLRGRVRTRVWPPHKLGPLPGLPDTAAGAGVLTHRTAQQAVTELWAPVPVDPSAPPRFTRPKPAQDEPAQDDSTSARQ
jgi:inner membrane protease subunit 1